MHITGVVRNLVEWSFKSQQSHKDPWGETSLTVHITLSDNKKWAVPAFWAGDQEWRVRFTPAKKGRYAFTTECADKTDKGLHNLKGVLEVAEAKQSSENVFIKHGAVRMAPGGKGFEHEDKTPFF